jgi:hypothetical protein
MPNADTTQALPMGTHLVPDLKAGTINLPQPVVTSNLAIDFQLAHNGQGGDGTDSRECRARKSCVL